MADMCGRPLLWPGRHSYLRDNDKKRGSALGSSEKEMMPMACVGSLDRAPGAVPSSKTFQRKPSLLRRWLDILVAAQQRRADREIAHYLVGVGALTDDAEREIERRLYARY
jgi:hypothetical protein